MTDTLSIGPDRLKTCFFKAAECLENNYEILNNLNVFPVPDGDTGTNMLATFRAGVQVLRADSDADAGKQRSTECSKKCSIRDIADRMNPELIKHSRGNSGFILARFFHGFFEAACPAEALEAEHLAGGFSGGLYQVNTSLFAPTEGTMVTIIRAMTEYLSSEIVSEMKKKIVPEPAVLLGRAIIAGREALEETPRLLPILARAGVVDSGALGFIFLMEGFLRGLTGEAHLKEREEDYRFLPIEPEGENELPESPDSFGYCTEITAGGLRKFSMDELSEFLRQKGDSIALVREGDFLKLHIHTDEPEEIVGYMERLGKVEHVKIDDLTEQVSRYTRAEDSGETCAVLAFIPGEGFRDIFASLGVEYCIPYAAHLPSAGEILEYLEGVSEQNVIILPNNRNILPAVMPAAERSRNNVFVLHTSTIIEGLTSAYGFSANDRFAENLGSMKECLELATGIFIYRSTAESRFNGQLIREGEFFALVGETLLATGRDLSVLVLDSIRLSGVEEIQNITFFYQNREVLEKIEGLPEELARNYGEPEIELLYGGQFRESLIISLE